MAGGLSYANLLSLPSMDIAYQNTLDFDNLGQQKSWFEAKVIRMVESGTKVDAEKNTLTVKVSLEQLENVDYLYLDRDGRRYYYFILEKKHNTPSSTVLTLKPDVWNTYYFDWIYLDTFIERCHVPRWNSENADLPAFEYVDEGLPLGEHEIRDKEVICDLNKTYIMASTTPLGILQEGGYKPPTGGGGEGGDCWLQGSMSPDGFRFLKGYEGFGRYIYSDSGGVPTIGYGTTSGDTEAWKQLTASQPCQEQDAAQIAYKSMTNSYGKPILDRVKELGCKSQQQFDALVDIAYNAGTGRILADNDLTLAIKRNPMDEAYIRPIWESFIINDAAGNPQPGLVARRKAEADIYFDGIYEKRPISYIPHYDGTVTENGGNGWLPDPCTGGGGGVDPSGNSIVSNEWGDNWLVPCKGEVTSLYGWRKNPVTGEDKLHKGVDVGAPAGTPFLASADGEVIINQWDSGFGNWLRIRSKGKDGKDVDIDYPHMIEPSPLKVGMKVKRGEQVGKCGSTGNSTGPHLHWQFNRGSATINPAPNWKVGEKI